MFWKPAKFESEKMPTSQPLSRIKKVGLRTVWENEARDFTPWLAEHIQELGDALDLRLGLTETESSVGSRSLDILAINQGNDSPVIIENQLESSDGDHLSRLLIYAAGKDADVVVWVASEFEDEHLQVLQWLNNRTTGQTRFFGVVVELWRIDDSRPAPYFRVAGAPNDWRKQNAIVRGTPAIPGHRRRYREFRKQLEERLNNELGCPFDPGDDNSSPWCVLDASRSGIRYSVDFPGQIYVSFQTHTDNRPPVDRQTLERCYELYDSLEQHREAIESSLSNGEAGARLVWTREWQRNRGSQIALHHGGTFRDWDERSDDLHTWIIQQYSRFRETFEPYLEEFGVPPLHSH